MSVFLGFDTSNYTTSVAIYDDESGKMINQKMLLPVEENSTGLMQSKALFCHVRQLPDVMGAAFSAFYENGGKTDDIKAAAVSTRPRNVDGSYMPVFLAGVNSAKAIAFSHNIPCFDTAHQVGHILAALYSANRLDLINQPFLAFHVSGGTTECLLITPDEEEIIKCEIVAHSLDLKAGQAIDRVGVMMGLRFPAGAALDELSKSGKLNHNPKPTLKGCDCCLSGLENICKKMYQNGENNADIARFAIEYVCCTIEQMSKAVTEKYGEMPFVYAGGVMSNSLIKERIGERGIFADPKFSSDNAAGVAIAASLFYKKER